MTRPWLHLGGSEKLHPVNTGGWHEGLWQRASKLVPMGLELPCDEAESSLAFALGEASGRGALGESGLASAADLPPEIAELIFGPQAS